MYCDRRLAGVEKLYLYRPKDADMMVPDSIRKCVVFLGCEDIRRKYHVKGTAFLVSRPLVETVDSGDHTYLVTAKHVITGIRDLGVKEVSIRMNYKNGEAKLSQSNVEDWRYHPTDEAVDVAVLAVPDLDPWNLDQFSIPWKMMSSPAIVKNGKLELGEEVFMPGLFSEHYGKNRNLPIIRAGNIAAMQEELVATKNGPIDAYLVETRSIGGLSGSPVFINLEPTRFHSQGRYFYYLLGLMHGHWDDDDSGVNMGLGIVVPAEKITEVVTQEVFAKMENETRAKMETANLPTPDSVTPNEETAFTKEDFESALKKVSRKLGPEK